MQFLRFAKAAIVSVGRGVGDLWRPWEVKRIVRGIGRCLSMGWAGCQVLPQRMVRALAKARLQCGDKRVLRNTAWVIANKVLGPPRIHTNGCGDFTLLHRESWFWLQGYPELPLWSMHLDSFLCYMAVASGIKERVLQDPCIMFHIEHGNSWVVMTPEERLRTFAMRPWIDLSLLGELWAEAYRTRRPVRFNDERWGLADRVLGEVVLGGERAGRE